MRLHLSPPPSLLLESNIRITGSKSESNRLLLLQALYPNITIDNISNSEDSGVMQKGLLKSSGTVDIHHAGTAMRFLTGYFAVSEGKEVVLTGSKRMKERPIAVLVDALRSLGAQIEYEGDEGFPPLKIVGKRLVKNRVGLPANISSQYISSLLLVAPSLENGLELELVGKITSVPYIKMTLALLEELGISTHFSGNKIGIAPKRTVKDTLVVVESDWSSASYFYSIMALADIGSEIVLGSYKKNSLQGDSILHKLYSNFGVTTTFDGHTIILRKLGRPSAKNLEFELSNTPDIAQTIAVTCLGLGMGCHLSGLHTLKIKETDRLKALHTELSKLGAHISVTDRDLTLKPLTGTMKTHVDIATYNDHRMAMAFAPLAMRVPIIINDAEVVSKSYPDFWDDLRQLHFGVQEA